MVTDVCDGGGTMEADPDLPAIRLPEGYQKYTDPRLVPPITLALENEVNVRRLEAVRQFARLNAVNRQNGAAARVGILSTGKTYYDLMQALRDLKVRDGIRIGKIGMPFPLDAEFVKRFAEGLETILVVEEKRSFLEMQLREILYDQPAHPAILGKSHFPPIGELDPDKIAKVLCDVLNLNEHRQPAPSHQSTSPGEALGRPPSGFLQWLSPQSLHAAAGGSNRRRRHWLPHHGDAADGSHSRYFISHAHGRRRRALDRDDAVRGSYRTFSRISATARCFIPGTWRSKLASPRRST